MLNRIPQYPTAYETWFAFKRDLESKLCCRLNNVTWLKIQPKKPLPWSGFDMRVALSRILRY